MSSNLTSVADTWRKYIADLNNGKLSISERPMRLSFKYPGLTLSHYDREGNPDIVSVLKFLIEVRNCGLLIPYDGIDQYFCQWNILMKNALNFVTSTSLTFSRDFYKSTIAKWPLDAVLSLGYVGNSSYGLSLSLYASGISNPLVAHNSQYVFVDKVSRLPKRHPDWFISKYKDTGFVDEPLRVKTFSKPDQTFHHQVQVAWSDTDKNNHMNYSSYVHFAINALRKALRLKETAHSGQKMGAENAGSIKQALTCLKGITYNIIRNGLKNVQVCFVKEGLEGDVLKVHLWQEDDDLNILCIVELVDGQPLCHIQLSFFNTLSHL